MIAPVRFLVVDDDPDILSGTARLLERAGYTVDTASSGEDALQAVRVQRPDLLLLDHDLPGISGVEVCRRVKQDPALANILVVLVSTLRTKSDEQAQGLESGADGYIVRPIANRELLARVESYVRILRLTRSLRRAHLASAGLTEDAVEGRNRLEAANEELRVEIAERRRAVDNDEVVMR